VTELVQARVAGTMKRKHLTVAPLEAGELILNRFRILNLLGAGGMGEVYVARQLAVGGFDREVVIKRILPRLSKSDNRVNMFLAEARLAARISHPNVVQIFDVVQTRTQHFIIMEYVKGWDLNWLVKAARVLKRPFPPEIAAWIAAGIAAGLHAAHTSVDAEGKPDPIIHRDVSPHNVLVSMQGHVKLSDFGIATASRADSLTPGDVVKGKPLYLTPEAVQGEGPKANPAMDVFALGLVLYQLLALVHPFQRRHSVLSMKALAHDEAPPPSSIVPGVPAELDAIVARALQKDPQKRYLTALEMEQALLGFIGSRGQRIDASHVAGFASGLTQDAKGVLPNSSSDDSDSDLTVEERTPNLWP
jgi:serine/threonine-protein kinase